MSGTVWRTHLRLAVRTWGLWLVLALGIGLVVVSTSGGPISRMFYNFNEMAAPFFFLGQMLLVAAASQRERSERVDELIEALPYDISRWVLGRFLVHYLLWLGGSVLLWGTGGLLVVLAGHPLDLRHLVLNWAVVAPVTVAFTTAIALTVGSLARPGVLTYFLTFGAWLVGPFSQIFLSKSSDRLMLPVAEWYASGRIFPHATTGFFYNDGLLAANRGVVLGMAGIALAVTVLLGARRRSHPARRVVAALVLAVLLVVGSTASMAAAWNSRYSSYEAEVATAAPYGFTKPAEAHLAADQYDLSVSLAPEQNRLMVEGSFGLTNQGDAPLATLPLTLRQNLSLTALAADGVAVPYERTGDHLTVALPLAPGETRRLTAAWEGEVYQWRLRDGPRLAAHVTPESILLPAHYGWYPLPGRHELTSQINVCKGVSCERGLMDLAVTLPPASFRVAVSGTDQPVIHNADKPVSGLFLMTSPFPVQESHGLLLSFSPAHRVQAERIAAELAPMIAAYEALVPRNAGPVRLIETHDALYYGAPWEPSAALGATPGSLLLYSLEVGRYWPGYFEDAYDSTVQGLWWPADGRKRNQQALYRSLADFMEYARAGDPPGIRFPPFTVLLALDEAKGREASVRVLREMHRLLADGGPSLEQFAHVVRQSGGDSPAVADALRSLEEQYR